MACCGMWRSTVAFSHHFGHSGANKCEQDKMATKRRKIKALKGKVRSRGCGEFRALRAMGAGVLKRLDAKKFVARHVPLCTVADII